MARELVLSGVAAIAIASMLARAAPPAAEYAGEPLWLGQDATARITATSVSSRPSCTSTSHVVLLIDGARVAEASEPGLASVQVALDTPGPHRVEALCRPAVPRSGVCVLHVERGAKPRPSAIN